LPDITSEKISIIVEHFVDVSTKTFDQIAKQIRKDKIMACTTHGNASDYKINTIQQVLINLDGQMLGMQQEIFTLNVRFVLVGLLSVYLLFAARTSAYFFFGISWFYRFKLFSLYP
jgi:hypothetical protein